MERRKSREAAFELLFEHEFKKDEEAAATVRLAEMSRDLETDGFTERLYFGVLDAVEAIDKAIAARAVGWKTARMSRVSLTVLRIAVCEMMFFEDIPFTVSINEAVELAKKFDDEKAPAFVNGILNGVAEDLGLKNAPAGEMPPAEEKPTAGEKAPAEDGGAKA